MLKKSIFFVLKVYKKTLSPLFGNACRFTPTCSEYCKDAITHHGIIKGLLLTVWRVLRCNPFCRGGDDPASGKTKTL